MVEHHRSSVIMEYYTVNQHPCQKQNIWQNNPFYPDPLKCLVALSALTKMHVESVNYRSNPLAV